MNAAEEAVKVEKAVKVDSMKKEKAVKVDSVKKELAVKAPTTRTTGKQVRPVPIASVPKTKVKEKVAVPKKAHRPRDSVKIVRGSVKQDIDVKKELPRLKPVPARKKVQFVRVQPKPTTKKPIPQPRRAEPLVKLEDSNERPHDESDSESHRRRRAVLKRESRC